VTKGKEPEESSDDEEETTPAPAPSVPDGLLKYLDGIEDLTDAQRLLLTALYDANGQDAYDAEAAAVGRLKQDEYLALPQGLVLPRVQPKDVGLGKIRDKFSARNLAAIYYLNKQRAPAGENAIHYAMIRMEAVKCGWVAGQKEIMYLPFDKYKEAMVTLVTDLGTAGIRLETFKLAAFLIPLACEHTFRTMGHHYITGMAAEYQARYRKTLKACLALEIMDLMQPASLFHHVLHWVSPERSFNVLAAQLGGRTLPDALVLRASAPPAGWAVITTTAAVLAAMKSANIYDEVDEEYMGDLEIIVTAADTIKSNVRKWHKAFFAYGVSPPTAAEVKSLDDARQSAIAFSPYAQGFIEGTLKDAALGQAMALKKHADLNPVARTRAARFFRQLARSNIDGVADLFKTSLRVDPKTRADDEDDA
jgi:hypothetical protein